MLERIKTMLGIEDSEQDAVLNIIIENVKSHLRAMLGKEPPPELDFIIEEITIRRYNRIGSEGMTSESVEGHSVNFYDLKEEFTPYESIIASYKEPPEKPGRGRVMFL